MLLNYALLKGTVAKDLEDSIGRSATHHNFIISAQGLDYQLNIDIQSTPNPNVKVFFQNHFDHEILHFLGELPENSLTSLEERSRDYRLDYFRSGIFSQKDLEQAHPEEAAEISDLLDASIKVGSSLYLLGEYYDDMQKRETMPHGLQMRHKHHFLPPRGLHDIHMNQGTPPEMHQSRDNGIYQDGALFLKMPDQTTKAFFFVFKEQCTSTDDTGSCIA